MAKHLKLKIWKKINQRIRIVKKDNDLFSVESRYFVKENWKSVNDYSSFKRALHKKHSYIIMIILRDLGLRNEFVKRRTIRNNKQIKTNQ
jgi:hypothetical protein